MNNFIIKQSNYILFLGIFIEENLNWKKQINNIKFKLNKESLLNIYYFLFQSFAILLSTMG